MKKIISVLAMALLVIAAAQAQEQTRRMVVHLNNGQVVRYNTENVEDVTFEISDLPDVPTTIDQAKAMLVGYWRINSPDYDDVNFERFYYIITEDLEILDCIKIKDSGTDEFFAEYAGKYVVTNVSDYLVFPSDDPTVFYLGDEYSYCTNLQIDSFELISSDANYPCVRVEPFEYEYFIPEDGLMKK